MHFHAITSSAIPTMLSTYIPVRVRANSRHRALITGSPAPAGRIQMARLISMKGNRITIDSVRTAVPAGRLFQR
jgi:hypothetical protein